ncbi:tetratricopeptide repeat protein [Streptomyces sp. NRRL B-24484]|uniref:tetratricopeptide repeat protein n=1 Tax=Streptomyces sp. NRRL B-24484 TaxID=1463833 RepID=UPI000694FFB7|nr:tetratricopeptide repeat protein [Streptomyces sp. NRRL B-24484]
MGRGPEDGRKGRGEGRSGRPWGPPQGPSQEINDLVVLLRQWLDRRGLTVRAFHAELTEDDFGEPGKGRIPSVDTLYRRFAGDGITWQFVSAVITVCTEDPQHARQREARARALWNAAKNRPTPPAGSVPPPPPAPQWPIVVGAIPILASAFQPREPVRGRIDEARAGNGTVVLSQVLAGGGGIGKSQLAASYAWQAVREGTDVVVWAHAADPVAVLLAYAEAAVAVQVPGASGAPDRVQQDARRFLNWLSTTERSWLVVLDDVADFTATAPIWPGSSRRNNGRVLATTRQRGAHASGGGRAIVPMDVYDSEEGVAYLRDRLTTAGFPYLLDARAADLSEALGRLPLALAHAAAYMVNQHRTCTDYLELFRERTRALDAVLPQEADTELYGRPVTAALLISLDAAQQTHPKGLAAPAIRLAGLLDPAGHPRELWTTRSATRYLAEQRAADARARTAPGPPAEADAPDRDASGPPPVSADEALSVLALLHGYNLLSSYPAGVPLPHRDEVAAHREVSVHALTARAARDTTPEPHRQQAAVIFALYELWPEEDHTDHRLALSLRANTAALRETAGGEVLQLFPGFALRHRAGLSLLHAGLHAEAAAHWTEDLEATLRELGPDHENTLAARANLASALSRAGRAAEAAALHKRVAVEFERLRGADDPSTLSALANLAAAYTEAGLHNEAESLKDHVLAARERVLGVLHPDTVTSRNNLALTYEITGRYEEALALQERVVAERALLDGSARSGGPAHPDTLVALAALASSYARAGRTAEATEIEEEVLAARERLLGPDHPDTLNTRVALASSYAQAGRTEEAVTMQRKAADDLRRVQGPDHPDTLKALANLAVSCRRTGRHEEAVRLSEGVLFDRVRVLGRDHQDTLISAGNLVNAYATAGETAKALGLAEPLVAQLTRVFGPTDDTTLSGRHAVALLRTHRGEDLLAEDPARAAADAAVAIMAVGPHVEPRLPALDEALEDAQRLARLARAALERKGTP